MKRGRKPLARRRDRYGNMKLYDAIPAFHESFFERAEEKTALAYDNDFKKFCQFFARYLGRQEMDKKLAGYHLLNRGHQAASLCLHAYKSEMEKTSYATATINRRLAALKSYLSEANSYGLIDWILKIRPVRQRPGKKVKGPTPAEMQRLWIFLKSKDGFEGSRDRLIFCLFYFLGLRKSEIAALRLKSIDMKQQILTVKSKGYRDAEYLEIPSRMIPIIREYLGHLDHRRSKLLYLDTKKYKDMGPANIFTCLMRWERDMGHSFKIRPHGLRHSAITTALIEAQKNGINFEEVMHFSRHKHIGTLLRYRDQLRNCQLTLANLITETGLS